MRRHFQNGFLGTSHRSTLKDTSTALLCPQKDGKLKKMTESPKLSRELFVKRNHTLYVILTEKFEIANYPDDNILNKRTEIIAKCRHRRKHLLTSFDNVT